MVMEHSCFTQVPPATLWARVAAQVFGPAMTTAPITSKEVNRADGMLFVVIAHLSVA